MNKKKIVFVGGHHNAALLIAKNLIKKNYQVYWFGHKQSMFGDKGLTLEYKEVIAAKIPFYNLKSAKTSHLYSIWEIIKLFSAFYKSFVWLKKIKPNLVLSFGGYLSFPVVISAKLLKIKIIIMEQTREVGLANRILAPFASKILLVWKSSQKYFANKKTYFTGLPLEKIFFEKSKTKNFFKRKKPTILVTGGKQGSHFINLMIKKNLNRLLKNFNLIHICGGNLKTKDFYYLNKARKSLIPEFQKNYILVKHLPHRQMVMALKAASIVISRAGAHITYELAALGKPAILIPFPWTYKYEQFANAKFLAKKKGVLVIEQKEISAEILWEKIMEVNKKLSFYKKMAEENKKLIKKDALKKILRIINETLGWN